MTTAEGWVALQLPHVLRDRWDVVQGLLWLHGAASVQEEDAPGHQRPPRQPWDEGPETEPAPVLTVTAWFESEVPEALLTDLARHTAVSAPQPVAPVDWEQSSRDAFPRLTCGPFIISPPWSAEPGDLVIEPGSGFGTGHHASTKGALTLLGRLDRTPDRVLDVGTGSGILALAAKRLGAHTLHGIDIDEDALSNARANAHHNHIRGVTFSATPLADIGERFDLVCANLYAELLVALSPALESVVQHDLILAGVLLEREHLVTESIGRWARCVERLEDGEWVASRWQRVNRS